MGRTSFEKTLGLTSSMFKTPVTLMSIVDHEKNQRMITIQNPQNHNDNVQERHIPLTRTLCQTVVDRNAVVAINDTSKESWIANNVVDSEADTVAYLGVPFHSVQGLPLGALCVCDNTPHSWSSHDISTLENLASSITDSIKIKSLELDSKALRTEQVKFNYSISHDLKSPVNTLHLLLCEMKEMWICGDIEGPDDFLIEALNTVDRMHVMIEDTLDYIQLERHNYTDYAATSLTSIITDVQKTLAEKIAISRAEISNSKLPTLNANSRQMNILFFHLLSNAIKFCRSDIPPVISIKYESLSDGLFHKIVVSDNGIGIDKEHHDAIFSPYTRLHTREQYSGTGLGLSICRRIVSLHGGRMEMESAPDNGTDIIILLPRDISVCQAA